MTAAPDTMLRISLIFTISLSAVAVDSLIPAIPLMVEAYASDPALGQLTVGAYLAGYGVGQIPVGLASDRFGRRPVLLVGLAVFTLMSGLTLLAPTMEVLLLLRFVQGLAGTVGPVVTRAVARDTHSGAELGRIMALLVTALAAAAMIAPMVGTVLVIRFGWTSPLWLNVMIGVVCFVMVIRFVPETHTPRRDSQLLSQSLHSLRRFLSEPVCLWGSALVGATFFAYFSIATALASILVDYFGFEASQVGWGFALAVAFYMMSAQTGRMLSRTVSQHALIAFGTRFYLAALVAGIYPLWLLYHGEALPLWWAAAPVFIFLCGKGLVFAAATAVTLDPVPDIAGFAASCLGTVQMGFGTLGAALTAYFYDGTPASLLVILLLGAATAAFSQRFRPGKSASD